MNAWTYIIFGGCLILAGTIMAGYGWHVMPKSEKGKPVPNRIQVIEPRVVPSIDIEFERVKAEPEFAQFEVQFSYDIILHNKSSQPISKIRVHRAIDPNKNKQKIAIHPQAQGKIAPFHEQINVLGPGEKKKIYREYSPSYEFFKFEITYMDQYEQRYLCLFEGDRDGVFLISNKEITPQKE